MSTKHNNSVTFNEFNQSKSCFVHLKINNFTHKKKRQTHTQVC